MAKYWLTGAVALAMMNDAALAQSAPAATPPSTRSVPADAPSLVQATTRNPCVQAPNITAGSKGRQVRILPDLMIGKERIAIDHYRELICYFGEDDPATRTMLEGILVAEEEHASDLHDLLVDHEGILIAGPMTDCL
jgi:hypothetical protein